VAEELLPEVLRAPGAWLVVLPGRKRLVSTVVGVLLDILEKLAAALLWT